jgi:hypothetical protein
MLIVVSGEIVYISNNSRLIVYIVVESSDVLFLQFI